VWSLGLSLLRFRIGILELVNQVAIQVNSLTELLKILPVDATVRGLEEGLIVKNADGSGKVVVLNDNLSVPDAAETNTSQPIPMEHLHKTRYMHPIRLTHTS
jgi:hypothetical protein